MDDVDQTIEELRGECNLIYRFKTREAGLPGLPIEHIARLQMLVQFLMAQPASLDIDRVLIETLAILQPDAFEALPGESLHSTEPPHGKGDKRKAPSGGGDGPRRPQPPSSSSSSAETIDLTMDDENVPERRLVPVEKKQRHESLSTSELHDRHTRIINALHNVLFGSATSGPTLMSFLSIHDRRNVMTIRRDWLTARMHVASGISPLSLARLSRATIDQFSWTHQIDEKASLCTTQSEPYYSQFMYGISRAHQRIRSERRPEYKRTGASATAFHDDDVVYSRKHIWLLTSRPTVGDLLRIMQKVIHAKDPETGAVEIWTADDWDVVTKQRVVVPWLTMDFVHRALVPYLNIPRFWFGRPDSPFVWGDLDSDDSEEINVWASRMAVASYAFLDAHIQRVFHAHDITDTTSHETLRNHIDHVARQYLSHHVADRAMDDTVVKDTVHFLMSKDNSSNDDSRPPTLQSFQRIVYFPIVEASFQNNERDDVDSKEAKVANELLMRNHPHWFHALFYSYGVGLFPSRQDDAFGLIAFATLVCLLRVKVYASDVSLGPSHLPIKDIFTYSFALGVLQRLLYGWDKENDRVWRHRQRTKTDKDANDPDPPSIWSVATGYQWDIIYAVYQISWTDMVKRAGHYVYKLSWKKLLFVRQALDREWIFSFLSSEADRKSVVHFLRDVNTRPDMFETWQWMRREYYPAHPDHRRVTLDTWMVASVVPMNYPLVYAMNYCALISLASYGTQHNDDNDDDKSETFLIGGRHFPIEIDILDTIVTICSVIYSNGSSMLSNLAACVLTFVQAPRDVAIPMTQLCAYYEQFFSYGNNREMITTWPMRWWEECLIGDEDKEEDDQARGREFKNKVDDARRVFTCLAQANTGYVVRTRFGLETEMSAKLLERINHAHTTYTENRVSNAGRVLPPSAWVQHIVRQCGSAMRPNNAAQRWLLPDTIKTTIMAAPLFLANLSPLIRSPDPFYIIRKSGSLVPQASTLFTNNFIGPALSALTVVTRYFLIATERSKDMAIYRPLLEGVISILNENLDPGMISRSATDEEAIRFHMAMTDADTGFVRDIPRLWFLVLYDQQWFWTFLASHLGKRTNDWLWAFRSFLTFPVLPVLDEYKGEPQEWWMLESIRQRRPDEVKLGSPKFRNEFWLHDGHAPNAHENAFLASPETKTSDHFRITLGDTVSDIEIPRYTLKQYIDKETFNQFPWAGPAMRRVLEPRAIPTQTYSNVVSWPHYTSDGLVNIMA